MILLHVIAAWLLADAESGLVHYAMDKWLKADGLFSTVTFDNELHHANPRSIVGFTFSENVNASLPALLISFVLWYAGAPVFLWLSFFFLTFGNLVHRFAHSRIEETPRLVQFLQAWGIFQSPGHHAGHHYTRGVVTTRASSVRRYCVMTNFVNKLFERNAK